MKTPVEQAPAPLVSDELAIQCKKDADEMYPPHLAPDEIIGDHFMLVRLAVAKALYKERKDLSKMRAERDELVGALRSVVEFVEKDLTYAPHRGQRARFPSYSEGAEISEEVDYALNPSRALLSKYKTE